MEVREVRGEPVGDGLSIGVVVATFNAVITEALTMGALQALEEAGVERVVIAHVPGALELGIVARRLADAGHDGVIAIGAVIEGETDHYQHVAEQSASALREVALSSGIPIGNAVLTVREFSHARERSRPGPGNKGAETARAVLETIQVLRQV